MRAVRVWPLFWGLVAGVAGLFLAIGGDSFATTSRAVLHGLCAQRPTHSFTIGSDLLPFDARMTGIYSGALWTWVVLAMRRRLLASADPPLPVVILLVGAVGVMAIDGFNALFVDLGHWHPYEPRNVIRFFTGFGTGVAITSLEVWLIGSSLYRLASRRPSWPGVRDLWWVIPASVATIGVILVDWGWTYPVFAALLMSSAWITVTGLLLVIVVSLLRVEARIVSVRPLEAPMVVSAIAALFVMIGLAQLRFWLERTLGIPQDIVAMVGVPHGAILNEVVGSIGAR